MPMTYTPDNRNRVIAAKDQLYKLYDRFKGEEYELRTRKLTKHTHSGHRVSHGN